MSDLKYLNRTQLLEAKKLCKRYIHNQEERLRWIERYLGNPSPPPPVEATASRAKNWAGNELRKIQVFEKMVKFFDGSITHFWGTGETWVDFADGSILCFDADKTCVILKNRLVFS